MGTVRKLAVTAWVLGPLGLVLVIGAVWWLRSGFQGATVPSESMSPTYAVGDRVIFEGVGGGEIRRGDVVLYTAPERFRFGSGVMQRVAVLRERPRRDGAGRRRAGPADG
ncbi:S26 family signal peptidase [Streptomyces sp. S.PNR 29]|uniref:S26 family signal peptidase n=1 Tax=Streptomyces sp. S.PNR 29 TaxID=2973805 RepID=UPI0025B22E15|nr:S26 family signal peptidase [Streptomyces sp. S.PNR 29]MDN0200963.1 S26 family signal peptidase [Streptomyces sp. S.PNR 29]